MVDCGASPTTCIIDIRNWIHHAESLNREVDSASCATEERLRTRSQM